MEVAADGHIGIELARAFRPHVVLLDLVLPGLNGFDAATLLKRDEETEDIPLVAVTASWLGSEAERLRGFGFEGALRKPFGVEPLLEELEKVLRADDGEPSLAAHQETPQHRQ